MGLEVYTYCDECGEDDRDVWVGECGGCHADVCQSCAEGEDYRCPQCGGKLYGPSSTEGPRGEEFRDLPGQELAKALAGEGKGTTGDREGVSGK